MKKILIGFLVGVMLVLTLTSAVGAQCDWGDCCEFECETACWRACCANETFDYEVSYKEPVYLYFEQWGFGYWTSEWVTEMVEDMHDKEEAAESLGLRAGYDCWVTKVF